MVKKIEKEREREKMRKNRERDRERERERVSEREKFIIKCMSYGDTAYLNMLLSETSANKKYQKVMNNICVSKKDFKKSDTF